MKFSVVVKITVVLWMVVCGLAFIPPASDWHFSMVMCMLSIIWASLEEHIEKHE